MQQRLQRVRRPPVPGFVPEQDVRAEGGDGQQAFREALQVRGQQPEPGEGQAGEHDQEQRRQDAPGAPFVEMDEGEAAPLHVGQDDGRDQVAADDEEDVDADITAAEARHAGMEQDHGDDGDGPEPVDFRTVFHGRTLPDRVSMRHRPGASSVWVRDGRNAKGPALLRALFDLVAGAGFEPTTFDVISCLVEGLIIGFKSQACHSQLVLNTMQVSHFQTMLVS